MLVKAEQMTKYNIQDTEQELVKSLLYSKGLDLINRPVTQQNSSMVLS